MPENHEAKQLNQTKIKQRVIMTEDNVWTTEEDYTENGEEKYYDEKRTGTDWSQVLVDFGKFLDKEPSSVGSRFNRLMTNWVHMLMTLATGGAYVLAYFSWYFYKFLQAVDAEDYQRTEYVTRGEKASE